MSQRTNLGHVPTDKTLTFAIYTYKHYTNTWDNNSLGDDMAVSKSKNYENMRKYLDRNLSITSASKNSRLFFDKYTKAAKPTDWQNINIKDLEEYGIPFETLTQWREEMTQKGILICMATKEEMKDKSVNYKASMFKYGNKIKKYIEAELNLSIHDKIDSKADDERVTKLEEKVSILEENASILEENVQNLTTIVLAAFPPDTPSRRKIVQENIKNKDECIRKLAKEIERNIEKTGKMFN